MRIVCTLLAILFLLAPPPTTAQPPQTVKAFQVRFETTQGAFVVEAHPDWAPQGVARFRELVAAKYFDDSRFFRVVAKFIAQFGIAGDPEVTAAWKGRTIPDDPPGQSRPSNLRGTLAFAMTGPGTRSTQIYINRTPEPQLTRRSASSVRSSTRGAPWRNSSMSARQEARRSARGRCLTRRSTAAARPMPYSSSSVVASVQPSV